MSRPVVLDATVLSNFASTESLDWLGQSLSRPVVPDAVRGEIHRGVERGHGHLDPALPFLDESSVEVVSGSTSAVPDRLDDGEAAALAIAEDIGGVVATDDATARDVAKQRDVPVTGSVGLLVRGIENESLDVETANQWLQIWIAERNYYAPVTDIEEVIPDR